MLGRGAEWARIEAGLAALPDGGVVIALQGTPGVGKTTLWQAGVTGARAQGFTVLASAPGEPDAGLAFAGLGDLCAELPDEIVDELPEPQRRALSRALLIEGDTDVAPNPQALPRAVLTVLRSLASRAPVLVAVDDEQWLDPPTARALAFALPRLRDAPLGVLMARRPATDGALWPVLTDDHHDSVVRIGVDPLDGPTIDALLAVRLGRRLSRRVCQRVYAASGGNPLYALAIARELRNGAEHGDVPIPRTLTDAIAGRLDGLSDSATRALLAVAAASRATLAVVQAVVDGFALSDLDAALASEVIEVTGDRVRFTHPLLASTLYGAAPPAQRRALQRRLAEVIEDPQQRARHLALGAEGPDRGVATVIEQGATVAEVRGAPDIAAELLEEAARLTSADAVETRRLRLIRAGELYVTGGDLERSRELLTSLLPELAAGPVRARALHALAMATVNWNAADALREEALANAQGHDRLRARILLDRSGSSSNRAQFAAMATYAHEALLAAERAGDSGLLASALASKVTADLFIGRPVDAQSLRRAVALEDPNQTTSRGSPSGTAALIAYWCDDYASARPQMQRTIQRARDHGEQYDLGALLLELSVLEWYAGDVELAETLRAASHETPTDNNDLWPTMAAAMFALRRGELEHAREAADRAIAIAQALGDLLIEEFPIMVLAALDLWAGQPAAAHARAHALRTSFTADGFGFISALTLDMWTLDIEALIAMTRLEEAQELADDLSNRARIVENPNAIAVAARCQGLVLAARGEVTAALEQMHAALAAHEMRLLRPELARTLLEQGSLLRRAKQKNAAKDSLQQALAIFEQIGARLWADRARDELDRIGLRRQTQEGLTPAQARVVELVCAGYSNKQIASTLYMSLRSVESHLTKAYRQLGVKSRAQLVGTIAHQAAEPSASRDLTISPR